MKDEYRLSERMLMGDFNPNHDPKNGRFTTGSGGGSEIDNSPTVHTHTKTFWAEKRADEFADYLKGQGAEDIHISSRLDGFGQHEWIVDWSFTDADVDSQVRASADYVGDKQVKRQISDYLNNHLYGSETRAKVDSFKILSLTGNSGDVEVEYQMKSEIPYTEWDSDGMAHTHYDYSTDYRKGTYSVVLKKGKAADSEKGNAMNAFDENWKTINGVHVDIDNDGKIVKGPAGLRNWSEGKGGSGGSETQRSGLAKNHFESAVKHVLKKDFRFDDLDYKMSDRYDFFDNDRGSLSVGAISDALDKAYQAGVEAARKSKTGSISAAQIEKNVKKSVPKWIGFSLEDKNSDGYDYWDNERGSFSNYDLFHALQSMYSQGYSSGDHIKTGDSEMALTMRMMTGDFNPNHDPDNGRFTTSGGGAISALENATGGGVNGSVDDFFNKMKGKSKAEAEKVVRNAKGNPNADEAYRRYLDASTGASTKYSGKTGKIKYMDTEFEVDNDGNITSGPKALLEGLKNPKEPGKGIKQGDVVIYSPKWRSPGEEKYIHVVLEERGPRLLLGTLNSKLSLGSTESVTREMVQSTGYNAGVSKDYEKYNDPE